MHAFHGIPVDGPALVADDFARKFPAQQVFLRLIVSGQEEAAFRMLRQLFFHLGDELLRGALSHGDSIVRAPDVDAYAAGRKLLRKGVDAFLQGRGRHIEAVIVGGIKVFPGKDINLFFQRTVKVLVKDAVRFVADDILISETLPGSELVPEFSGIFQGADVDDLNVRFCDREEEILESAVQLRTQVPEHHQLFFPAFRKFPPGIYYSYSIA